MKTAMLLAAGRGKRLRPLTDTTPKALCQVHGKPLIEHHIQRLAAQGFERIVINHAYLGDQIRRCLGNGSRWQIEIIYSPEPPGGLETGGGIVHALPLLGDDAFLVINADIYTDYPFQQLRLDNSHLAKLILIPEREGFSQDFAIDADGLLSNDKQHIFSGIACYHPQFFANQAIGRYSVTALIRAACENRRVCAELYQGLWYDIGSIHRLALANIS